MNRLVPTVTASVIIAQVTGCGQGRMSQRPVDFGPMPRRIAGAAASFAAAKEAGVVVPFGLRIRPVKREILRYA